MHTASALRFPINQMAVVKQPSPAPLFKSTGLVIRRVTEHHDLLATDLLVRRMYAWRGYLTKQQLASPRDPDHATLVAWQDGELAGTLTLSRDSGVGLLCESLYPKEVSELRAKQQKICEYSRFALDPEFRSPKLLDSFFRTAFYFARSHFGATDAVVEVNPRHSRFYERELGFIPIGPRRVCPRVDAPALLLHRNLRYAPKAWVSNQAA